ECQAATANTAAVSAQTIRASIERMRRESQPVTSCTTTCRRAASARGIARNTAQTKHNRAHSSAPLIEDANAYLSRTRAATRITIAAIAAITASCMVRSRTVNVAASQAGSFRLPLAAGGTGATTGY